jgi:hypothetical protein
MDLYIKTENGQVKNHPAFEENLIQAFGAVPENWERFVRIEPPTLAVYQVFDDPQVTYEKVNGVWTDVFHVRDMTPEEKAAKQQQLKDTWASSPDKEKFSNWVFDETTCSYKPPVTQ